MDAYVVEQPKLDKSLTYSYSVPAEAKERFKRKKKRAEEIGIRLFVLDEPDIPMELQELEDYIIDTYLDMDKDVPNELKAQYCELKKKLAVL